MLLFQVPNNQRHITASVQREARYSISDEWTACKHTTRICTQLIHSPASDAAAMQTTALTTDWPSRPLLRCLRITAVAAAAAGAAL